MRSRGSTQNDPNVFRFDSTRFVGRLKRPEGREANEDLQGIIFEVQIRSAFEHAWSVTTHALAYKGQKIDWKTLRLAAQLKAAVEQLDNLIVGFNEVARSISEQHWPEIQVKKRIEEFFAEQFASGTIPTEMKPDSWTRFCDNVYALLRSSEGAHEKRPHQLIEPAITALSEEIQRTTPEKFPRSISLTQFIIGVLIREKVVSPPLHRYIPLITEPLSVLYPEVQELTNIFDLELTTDY